MPPVGSRPSLALFAIARSVARSQPTAFIITGAAVAGFASARFLKSSGAPLEQCTLGPSNLQKTTGAISLYGQRSLITLDGSRCCDLSTYEVLKFPDDLGSQTASFGK